MGFSRQYFRLSRAELADLRAHPDEAFDVLMGYRREDCPERVCDVMKWWWEIDVVLTQAGIPAGDANGTEHIYPVPRHLLEEFEALDVVGEDRRPRSPATYLTPPEVQALAPRPAAVDFAATVDAIDPSAWSGLLFDSPEVAHHYLVPLWPSLAEFHAAAAEAGDALVIDCG